MVNSLGISETKVWNAIEFIQGGFLRLGGGSPLPNPGCEVINQSWQAGLNNAPLEREILRRQDYQIVRDDVLSIVGMPNGGGSLSGTLMWAGWNSIAVGTRDESHEFGETSFSSDGAGRQKPFMVAPGSLVSWSVPMVTASVAVLIETIETDPNLSSDADAKKPEVMKAVLGASATHSRLGAVNWSNAPVSSGPDRGFSRKPLDPVVGTGTCNIDRAHRVMTGGRFDGEITTWAMAGKWMGSPLFWPVSCSALIFQKLQIPSRFLPPETVMCGLVFLKSSHLTFGTMFQTNAALSPMRGSGCRVLRPRAMWPVMLPWTTWNTSH